MFKNQKVKNCTDIRIIYKQKNDNKDKVRLFGEKFVKNNKNKAKIIFNSNEYELKEFFEDIIHDDNKYEIRLTLKIFGEITNLSEMFSLCDSLYLFPDNGNFNESINNCQSLNTSKVRYMDYMFRGCKSLISLPDISKWNTSNVSYMEGMFEGCESLISLPDISKWDTSRIRMDMFDECHSLINLINF